MRQYSIQGENPSKIYSGEDIYNKERQADNCYL